MRRRYASVIRCIEGGTVEGNLMVRMESWVMEWYRFTS
jgi:hypothetical protein